MVDRQDIDALLVGALYGELTPADEARLAAHLESHPGDRAALEDLKTARQAVRESQIFETQHEPPQAVSALLLQEAHRRVPKPARAQSQHDEREGWFARLARSFFAHPAMAAAAMLVVVVGVAGTLYMKKGGDEFANKEATGAAPTPAAEPAPAAPTVAAVPPGGAAGSGMAVGLAEDNAALDQRVEAAQKEGELQKQADPSADRGLAHGKDEYKLDTAKGLAQDGDFKADRSTPSDGVASAERRRQVAQPAHASAKPSVAVNTPAPDLQPKEIDSPKYRNNPKAGLSYESQGAGAAPRADKSLSAMNDDSAPGGAPAQAAPVQPAPAPPPPPMKAPSRSAIASGGAAGPAPSSAPTANATVAKTAKNDVKPTDPQTAWAQDALTKAIAFAKNSNCKDAVAIELEIRNKAPAFYKANVADNRALKGCAQYLQNNVDQSEQRSKKMSPAKTDNEMK